MVAAVHAPMDEISATAGDDLAAAHVHGDAHHAMRGHAAGRGHHRGDLCRPCLSVKVGVTAGLSVELGIVVIGVCRAAEETQNHDLKEFNEFREGKGGSKQRRKKNSTFL